MKNDGTNLERLVKRIEKSLVPEGFSVEVNRRSYEDGLLVGEFDIVITGKVGSIPVKYLFECRDRPSDGPQGRGWIQQIIERRSDFKFDGVVAVSTTGFAPQAISLAKRENVSLRTVRTTDEIADGIQLVSFTLGNPEIIPEGECEILPINESDREFLTSEHMNQKCEITFRELTAFQGKTFYNFVLDNLPKTFDQESDGTRFHYLHVYKPLEVTLGNRKVMARSVRVKIRFRKGHIKGKTIAMRNYDSETGLIGQEVSVLFDAPNGPIKTDLIFGFHDEKVSVDILSVDGPWKKKL